MYKQLAAELLEYEEIANKFPRWAKECTDTLIVWLSCP